MTEVERRQMERFSFELPALLSTVDKSGQPKAFEVMTKNICAGGAFFITDKPLSVGTDVKMDLIISLKKVNKISNKKAHINVSGSVIRTDEKGMAICFDEKYTISPYLM